MMNFRTRQSGVISLYVLIFSSVSIIILSGFILWADANIKAVFRDYDQAQAFMIAESGIEYYRWHLAHAKQDYKDGTESSGPYTHEFRDKDGDLIGSYSLNIIPPDTGSTVVTLESTGAITANADVSKIIEAKLAIPSFARYAVVINDFVRFGEGTDIYGPIHSNLGVRVDGVAHNLVTSAVDEYNDPDHSGKDEFGVHTHASPIDPTPPATVPVRTDVFMAGREFAVAPVDFVGITQDLATMQSSAESAGFYRDSSEESGYHVVLKTNDTFDLYKVNKTLKAPNGCIEVLGQHDWDTWSIETETLLGNYPLPSNNILFFSDNVWVDGQIETARVSIGAGIFPENSAHYAHITVNNNLLYTNYDGQDILSLIAQGNVGTGLKSADILRIDGALFAQNGRVGRYYYRPASGNQSRCGAEAYRDTITLFGMIASGERYGFAYTDGTGYEYRIIIYDAHLLYGPPPAFPLTADYYTPIFWNEKK